jgi:hypothetical protein
MKNEACLGERMMIYLLGSQRDSLDVKIQGMDAHGEVTMSFPISAIDDADLAATIGCLSGNELMSALGQFHADQVGTMIIRKNIRTFFEFFMGMSDEDYQKKIVNVDHVHFGVGCNGVRMSMSFHGSLLYDIIVGMVNNVSRG